MAEEIISQFREKRQQLGYSQKQIAEYLGISPKAYSKIETGKNIIRTEYLIKLSKLFDMDELMCLKIHLSDKKIVSPADLKKEKSEPQECEGLTMRFNLDAKLLNGEKKEFSVRIVPPKSMKGRMHSLERILDNPGRYYLYRVDEIEDYLKYTDLKDELKISQTKWFDWHPVGFFLKTFVMSAVNARDITKEMPLVKPGGELHASIYVDGNLRCDTTLLENMDADLTEAVMSAIWFGLDGKMKNPALDMIEKAKAGYCDKLSDEEYDFLFKEVKDTSGFWNDCKYYEPLKMASLLTYRALNSEPYTFLKLCARFGILKVEGSQLFESMLTYPNMVIKAANRAKEALRAG